MGVRGIGRPDAHRLVADLKRLEGAFGGESELLDREPRVGDGRGGGAEAQIEAEDQRAVPEGHGGCVGDDVLLGDVVGVVRRKRFGTVFRPETSGWAADGNEAYAGTILSVTANTRDKSETHA